nr:immunoglobulin heavy chain junction region [Macaca mulatta]
CTRDSPSIGYRFDVW